VLSICEVIGLPPGNFFGALFPPVSPATKSEARLARGLGALHPNGSLWPMRAIPKHC
jgi:hypothetical protein